MSGDPSSTIPPNIQEAKMVKTHTPAPKTIRADTRAPAPVGHNGPSPDDVLFHLGLIKKGREVIKQASAAMKKINQRAKNIGITLEDLDDANMMLELGPEKATAKQARRIFYMRALQVPVGGQLQLFDNPVDAKAITQEGLLKEAFSWGRALGVANEPPDWQKYHQETDLGQEHQKGWYEGQEVYSKLTNTNAAADINEAKSMQEKADEKLRQMAEKKAEKDKAAADKAAAKVAKAAEKPPKAPPARGKKKDAEPPKDDDTQAASAAIDAALN